MIAKTTSEKLWYVFQLGNVIAFIATVFDQKREIIVELLAGVFGVQFGQLCVDHSPRPGLGGQQLLETFNTLMAKHYLFFGVFRARNAFTTNERQLSLIGILI